MPVAGPDEAFVFIVTASEARAEQVFCPPRLEGGQFLQVSCLHCAHVLLPCARPSADENLPRFRPRFA